MVGQPQVIGADTVANRSTGDKSPLHSSSFEGNGRVSQVDPPKRA